MEEGAREIGRAALGEMPFNRPGTGSSLQLRIALSEKVGFNVLCRLAILQKILITLAFCFKHRAVIFTAPVEPNTVQNDFKTGWQPRNLRLIGNGAI